MAIKTVGVIGCGLMGSGIAQVSAQAGFPTMVVDQAMKLGCGYPMGPFTLLDLVGLDTTLYVAEVMFDEFREPRFAPPPLLRRMVLAGQLGRKSGKGFYDYSTR